MSLCRIEGRDESRVAAEETTTTSFDSSQGSTIYERHCVHGMEGKDGSPKVVWTVIIRGVQLRNLFFGRVLEREPSTRDFENHAKAKFFAYIESDRKENRYDASPGAYSAQRMADMFKGAYMRRCAGLCGERVRQRDGLGGRDGGMWQATAPRRRLSLSTESTA